jgi:hypothetical protein
MENIYIYIIGLIVILSSMIWTIYKKKYNTAIALFITAAAYAVIVFLIKKA